LLRKISIQEVSRSLHFRLLNVIASLVRGEHRWLLWPGLALESVDDHVAVFAPMADTGGRYALREWNSGELTVMIMGRLTFLMPAAPPYASL
jgi:hypothetical protein